MILVCSQCGTATDSEHEFAQWWLSSYHVTRCPHHITEWQLRRAGVRRTKEVWRWVREGRRIVPKAVLGYAEPFAIEE